MRVYYQVDGQQVTAICETTRYPRVYEVWADDGPLLGYVERTLMGRTEAYEPEAAPDTVGARLLGTHVNMRDAVERVVRAANPEVAE